MKAIRTFGELLVTFGLVVLLFCGYELWGTGLYTQRQQDNLEESLRERWGPRQAAERSGGGARGGLDLDKARFRYGDVRRGEGLAILRIPRLGADYRYTIVQGAGVEQLKKGPGHYVEDDGTAMPGQVGNFVVSGHRTTYSAPFKKIDQLRAGDPVVVETGDTWFIYRVYDKAVVEPSQVEVTAPVPFHPGRSANKRRITLTTCHPMYTARQRLIVFGELVRAQRKTAGRPEVLA